MSKTITLDEYARTIVKPMVLARIKDGSLDDIISDPDILYIVLKDEEIIEAVVERLKLMVKNDS